MWFLLAMSLIAAIMLLMIKGSMSEMEAKGEKAEKLEKRFKILDENVTEKIAELEERIEEIERKEKRKQNAYLEGGTGA